MEIGMLIWYILAFTLPVLWSYNLALEPPYQDRHPFETSGVS